MTYKPASGSSEPDVPVGKGLRGPDKQQDERRVQRNNDTHGEPLPPATAAKKGLAGRQDTTAHEQARTDAGVPEGLRRDRKHPLSPDRGRSGEKR